MFKQKEYMKKYYQDNSEHLKLVSQQWRLNNPDKVKIQKRQWRENNPEYDKQWRDKNLEKTKTAIQQWRDNNQEKVRITAKKRNKRYRQTDIGKIVHQNGQYKRRAIGREIINTLTSQEWLDILEQYNYVCFYCGEEFTCENLPTKDHIIPISKGGDNTKENIVPACGDCNCRKHNKIYSVMSV